MKLESVTAELRPRSDWEAVDLGLALVRRDFWKLSGAWWLGMLPVVGIGLPLLWKHPFWFVCLFWWWAAIGSRMALFVLSRVLFGERPGRRELFREFPRAIVRRFGYRMLWARLSPWRPLTMPVEDLEGLRGKDFRNRCRVLMRRGDSSLVMLAMWRLFLTLWLALSLFCTGLLFVSQSVRSEWGLVFEIWMEGDAVEPPPGFAFAIMTTLCLAIWLVELFSTGAGFGIYVNHRTWIEGWDVELAFRRISARLARIGVIVLLAVSSFGVLRAEEGLEPAGHELRNLEFGEKNFLQVDSGDRPMVAGDGSDAEAEKGIGNDWGGGDPPHRVIEEVLADPDFEVKEETIRTPKPGPWLQNFFDWLGSLFGSGGSSKSSGGGGLEVISVLLKIALIVGVLALVGWLIWHFRHVFGEKREGGARIGKVRAKVVMGMEVTAESLPDDVAATALAAWRAGRFQEALGLLYRGSISWMIGTAGVEIAESDTESDCLQRARQAKLEQAGYFERLTDVWVRLAYARQVPGTETVESLCAEWPFRKGGVA